MTELREVIYVAWVEPGRGVVEKSGCSLHLSVDDSRAFAEDNYKQCDGNRVNFIPEGEPRKAYVTPALYEMIEKQSKGLRLYQLQAKTALNAQELILSLEEKLRE